MSETDKEKLDIEIAENGEWQDDEFSSGSTTEQIFNNHVEMLPAQVKIDISNVAPPGQSISASKNEDS